VVGVGVCGCVSFFTNQECDVCTLFQINDALKCPSERQSQKPVLIIYIDTFFFLPKTKFVFQNWTLDPDMFSPGFEGTKERTENAAKARENTNFRKIGGSAHYNVSDIGVFDGLLQRFLRAWKTAKIWSENIWARKQQQNGVRGRKFRNFEWHAAASELSPSTATRPSRFRECVFRHRL